MAMFNASPVREQVQMEIIAALTNAEPMTTAQLAALCETSESTNMLCQELNKLKKKGTIYESGVVNTDHGPRKTYQLAVDETDRLIEHQEADLDPVGDASQPDPIIEIIHRMRRRPDDDRYRVSVERLRAMAGCLDDGYSIEPDAHLTAWLYELAETLESEMAA